LVHGARRAEPCQFALASSLAYWAIHHPDCFFGGLDALTRQLVTDTYDVRRDERRLADGTEVQLGGERGPVIERPSLLH
jgi:hypothetical protein